MAKLVIAGTSDCPFYARIELLADKLARNLPHFEVTKFAKQSDDWKAFTEWVNQKHGWKVDKSPVVWRELLDRGGRGTLIGGANEFQEYVAAYYKEYSEMRTAEMLEVAEDNTRFKNDEDAENAKLLSQQVVPSKVVIIGASSAVAYHVLPYLARNNIFSPDDPISLHLYDDLDRADILETVAENLLELASPILKEVKVITDLTDSLHDAKQIIILDVLPRVFVGFEEPKSSPTRNTVSTPDLCKFEPREDWLKRRYVFFTAIGLLFKHNCPSSVRILISGNPGLDAESVHAAAPINFDVAVLQKAMAPKMSTNQIVGLVSPLEQRIRATLATNLHVATHDITNVIVWGNLGSRTHIDLSRARIYRREDTDVGVVGDAWFSLPLLETVRQPEWLAEEMQKEVFQKRSEQIPIYRGLSHAQAVIHLLNAWWNQNANEKEEIYSVVLVSEDWYGVPPGVAFSFPATRHPTSCWSVVQDVEMNPHATSEIEACIKSVLEDWSVVDPEPLRRYTQARQGSENPEQSTTFYTEDESTVL